jgi:hypothetical protein
VFAVEGREVVADLLDGGDGHDAMGDRKNGLTQRRRGRGGLEH